MGLSQRDKVIVVLLPMLVVLFAYYWHWYRPENDKLQKLRSQLVGYGMDAATMEVQVRNVTRELSEFKHTYDERLKALEEQRKTDEGKRQWGGDTPPEQRFQCFTRQLEVAGMRLVFAKRDEDAGNFGPVLNEALSRLSRWKVQLQGGYRQMQDFLAENRTSGWCVPVGIEMVPSSEMGKPAQWTLEIMI
ncbi:MAG: hypothetical protein IJU44_05670 [Kiritimatiellae bacterium]|nr:hypothetical protein [Kiritimatiellia bacterium]